MVIDDEVLGGGRFTLERNFIRDHFTLRAIISLHGDAFQQVGSRAKASILYLIKRSDASEDQPSVFVWESRYIGLDNVPSKTRPSVAERARKLAEAEVSEITAAFLLFLNGGKGDWLVCPERIGDRLDVKNLCRYSAKNLEAKWRAAGADWETLGNLVDRIEDPIILAPEQLYTFLKVQYNGGGAMRGEQPLGREITYRQVLKARAGDIVISKFNAVNGAVCVFPEDLEDCVISPMFYVLRVKPDAKARVDSSYLLAVLLSPAVLAEWLSDATGVGRHPVEWDTFRTQLIPLLPIVQQTKIGSLYREAREHELQIPRCIETAKEILAVLALDNGEARERLARAKPPK
jgi:type I restriction enzyme M protein